MAQEYHRISIPLMMLDGNIDVLLENEIEVNAVSMKRYELNGVVLIFHFGPGKKKAIEKGMQFNSAIDDPGFGMAEGDLDLGLTD